MFALDAAVLGDVPDTVNAADCRAYELPDISVPAAESLAVDVNSPTYKVVGAVYADPPKT